MEAEAVKTVLYLLLVLGGGVMVGVLAILFIISIATFGAWLAILISSLKSRGPQAYAGLGKMSRGHGRKVERSH
jgi:hypothetical protein